MQRWYDDKAMRADPSPMSWVSVIDGDKQPTLIAVQSQIFERIECECRRIVGREGVLKRDGPDWRYEVIQ